MCKECGCQIEVIEKDSKTKAEPETKEVEIIAKETPAESKRGWTGVGRPDDLPLM